MSQILTDSDNLKQLAPISSINKVYVDENQNYQYQ